MPWWQGSGQQIRQGQVGEWGLITQSTLRTLRQQACGARDQANCCLSVEAKQIAERGKLPIKVVGCSKGIHEVAAWRRDGWDGASWQKQTPSEWGNRGSSNSCGRPSGVSRTPDCINTAMQPLLLL